MAECVGQQDPPTQLIEIFLGNPSTLNVLLSNTEVRENMLDNASMQIAGLNEVDTHSLVRNLLGGIGTENDVWDQDRRDGALTLLELVDTSKLKGDKLIQIYTEAVSAQTGDADPYGTIAGLLDAGRLLAPYFPPDIDSQTSVGIAWSKLFGEFSDEEHRFIIDGTTAIIGEIPTNIDDLMGNPERRLGWREQPPFEPAEQELHDLYEKTVARQGTFKIALWENTSDFRTYCERYGVSMDRFWNLANPDDVVEAVETLDLPQAAYTRAYFDRALHVDLGIGIDEITPEQTRYLADEVVLAARHARQDILGTIGDFPDLISKFQQLANQAEGKKPKAQRDLKQQVTKFFQESGIDLSIASLPELISVLNNKIILKAAENTFVDKQQIKVNAAQILDNAFKLSGRSPDYSLSSRQREDLFLGDLTGDCTAYHLHTGMNAWTLPGWLANPGFNFFKITDQKKLVAKVGILLAIADGQPTLVVDSFEVGQDITDQQNAARQIHKGMRYLKQWAQGIGLNEVQVNTLSNSSDGVKLIKGLTKPSKISGLFAMGGLSGISEIRSKLIKPRESESIYLQSEVEDDSEEKTSGSEYIQQFEEIISQTILKAQPNERETIQELARNQNWDGLFTRIMHVRYPHVVERLGTEWTTYKRHMDTLEINDFGQAHPVSLHILAAYDGRQERSDSGPIAQLLRDQFDEETADAHAVYQTLRTQKKAIPDSIKDVIAYDEAIMEEAFGIDQILLLLKEMEFRQIDPQNALKQLYGKFETIDAAITSKVRLDRRLPYLSI